MTNMNSGGSRTTPTDNSPTEKVKRDAAKAVEAGKEEASKMTQEAKRKADGALSSAGEELEGFTGAIDAAAEQLSEDDKAGLAKYAHKLSSGIGSLANSLQNKSANELANDVKTLARQNPTGFLLGSVALGFALSRFAKATDDRDDENTTSGAKDSPKGTLTSPTRPSGRDTSSESRNPTPRNPTFTTPPTTGRST